MEVFKDEARKLRDSSLDRLGLHIELPTRIMYLNIKENEIASEWLPSLYFADWLDINSSEVDKIIADLKLEGKMDNLTGVIVYPPLTFEIISEEYSWIKKYKSLDNALAPSEMGEILGRDYRYITKEAISLGYKLRRGKFNKAALSDIREKELSVPFDEGWYTLRALAVEVDKDRSWVKNRLDELGFLPEKRRSLDTGITLEHYPPEALLKLDELKRDIPKYGEDWYTCGRLVLESEMSFAWVSRRLKVYEDSFEIRLDDMGVSRRHYPKSVVDTILNEAMTMSAKLDSSGWLNIKDAANLMGLSEKSIKRKFDKLCIVPERRRNDCGRPVYYYDPTDVKRVIKEENCIDESTLSRKIGKSVYWVCTRLSSMGIEPTRSGNGPRSRKMYPLEAIELLKEKLPD